MAVTYYGEVFASPLWDWQTGVGSSGFGEVIQSDFNPYHWGEVKLGRYINKVWDPVAGGWVRWTTDHIDHQGLEYPYPANWGSVLHYGVERIIMENV